MDTDSRNGTGAVVASDAQVTFVAEDSPLAAEILAQLDVLDPARVATRQGPGGRIFSYLEGAEVIDTANKIFGRGNWGYELVAMVQEGTDLHRACPPDRARLRALCRHRHWRGSLQGRRAAEPGRSRNRQEGRGDGRSQALPEELWCGLRPDLVLQGCGWRERERQRQWPQQCCFCPVANQAAGSAASRRRRWHSRSARSAAGRCGTTASRSATRRLRTTNAGIRTATAPSGRRSSRRPRPSSRHLGLHRSRSTTCPSATLTWPSFFCSLGFQPLTLGFPPGHPKERATCSLLFCFRVALISPQTPRLTPTAQRSPPWIHNDCCGQERRSPRLDRPRHGTRAHRRHAGRRMGRPLSLLRRHRTGCTSIPPGRAAGAGTAGNAPRVAAMPSTTSSGGTISASAKLSPDWLDSAVTLAARHQASGSCQRRSARTSPGRSRAGSARPPDGAAGSARPCQRGRCNLVAPTCAGRGIGSRNLAGLAAGLYRRLALRPGGRAACGDAALGSPGQHSRRAVSLSAPDRFVPRELDRELTKGRTLRPAGRWRTPTVSAWTGWMEYRQALVLVEGELNAVSIWQVCREQAHVLSWGPQSNILRHRCSMWLRPSPPLPQCWCGRMSDALPRKPLAALGLGERGHVLHSEDGLDANDRLRCGT